MLFLDNRAIAFQSGVAWTVQTMLAVNNLVLDLSRRVGWTLILVERRPCTANLTQKRPWIFNGFNAFATTLL